MDPLRQHIASEAMAQAQGLFKEQNLTLPAVAQEERAKITRFQKGVFGTKANPGSLYDLNAYVQELLTKKVDDYVMFGFAGHGANSQGIHYYAVQGNLALFIQLSAGGAATEDNEAVRAKINGIFSQISLFLDSMKVLRDGRALDPERRLLVIESDFYGSGWEWVDGQPGKIDESQWHTEDPFLEALNEVLEKRTEFENRK